MLRHENELTNHRIQWFLTINGFLFTAIAIFGNQPGRNYFGSALVFIAILTCVSFAKALAIGRKGWLQLAEKWEKLLARAPEGFDDVGVYGYRTSSKFENLTLPWCFLPWVMSLGWILVLLIVWGFPGYRPPGSYTPIAVESSKPDIRIFDTATGEPK